MSVGEAGLASERDKPRAFKQDEYRPFDKIEVWGNVDGLCGFVKFHLCLLYNHDHCTGRRRLPSFFKSSVNAYRYACKTLCSIR